MLTRLVRFWFGDDIFISYSRRDGFHYATNLANRLADNFSCSFDQLASEPGEEIPESLKKRLKRSSSLVLIGTKDAAQSELVEYELDEFRKTCRPIIPILFDGVRLRDQVCEGGLLVNLSESTAAAPPEPEALWANHIHGAAITMEAADGLRSQLPSAEVVRRISDSCRFMRKEQRQRAATWGASILFVFLVAIILVAAYIARVQAASASEMTQRAQLAADEATKQQLIAERAGRDAALAEAREKENNLRTEAAAKKADEQTKIAQQAGERASEATARADLQESNARRNLASNFYTQAQVEALNDPRRAIAWASNALQKAPANDPLRSLYGMMITHLASELPKTVINARGPIRTAIFSDADDRAIVFSGDGTMTLWDLTDGRIVEPSLNRDMAVPPEIGRTTFSHDGKWIAALVLDTEAMKKVKVRGDWHYRLRVWSAETGTLQSNVPTFWDGFEPMQLAFSANGDEIVIFGNGYSEDDDEARSRRMRVWERTSGIELKFMESFSFGRWQALRNRRFGERDKIPLSQAPARNWFLNVLYQQNKSVVEIRSIKDGKLIKSFKHEGKVVFADLSRNAKKLVVVSFLEKTKAELRIWDIDSGQSNEPVVRNLDRDSESYPISNQGIPEVFPIQDISPDGSKLLLERGGCDGLEIWYYTPDNDWPFERHLIPDWREDVPLRPCDSGIDYAFFSNDGKHIVETRSEGIGFFEPSLKVRIWDVKTRRLVTATEVFPGVLSHHPSLSTMKLNVATINGTLTSSKLLRNGSVLTESALTLPEDHTLRVVMLTPTRREILAVTSEPLADGDPPATLQLLDADSGAPRWTKDTVNNPFLMRKINVSPDGSRFVSSTRSTEPGGSWAAPVWWVQRITDGSVVPGFRGIQGGFAAMKFNRDGTMLVSSEVDFFSYQMIIRKWSAASGERVANFAPISRPGEFIQFSRFADYYLAASFQNNRNILVQSVDKPNQITELEFAENGSRELFINLFERALGIRLVRGGLDLIMDSGVTLSVNPSLHGVEIVNERLEVLIPMSTESFSPLGLDRGPAIEDISTDGTLLAVRTDDHTVRIYENRTGRPVSEPFWHEGNLTLVRFNGDTEILTITDRGEKLLWHVGQPNWKVPTWMTGLGEAISGFRLVNDIELQRIYQPEYLKLRQSSLKALQKAAASGDKDAQIVLRNWLN